VETIQQRDDVGPFVTTGGRCACRQWHASGVREAVDEDAFAFPAIGNALTTALARGKTNYHGAVLPLNHPMCLSEPE